MEYISFLLKSCNHYSYFLRISLWAFVIGELACGNLRRRRDVLGLLQGLPRVPVADQDEVLLLIERHDLMGEGIGFIDAHLLAATRLGHATRLWTRDKRLADAARALGVDGMPGLVIHDRP